MSHYIERTIDKLVTERDEAREALCATEAALQAVTALHVAWTELAVARGRFWSCPAEEAEATLARVYAAEDALVKLGVAREALS